MRDDGHENQGQRNDNSGSATLRWLLSMPPVPRPLIAVLAVGWWLVFIAGAWVENYDAPGQPWWLDIWKGSLGGNSFSAFGALLLKALLTTEVIIMIFTLAGNRRRIEDAAAKARQEGRQEGMQEGRREGHQEGRQEGHQEGRQEIRQQIAEWYESAKADFAAGRDPGPPPIFEENGNKPA